MEVISEEVFDELYWDKLIDNDVSENSSFSGKMFETYGQDLEFIKSQPDNRVLTVLDTDGQTWIVTGAHFVNRIGYLVSSKDLNKEFEVLLEY